jgi:hypothetical protein
LTLPLAGHHHAFVQRGVRWLVLLRHQRASKIVA